MSEQNSLQNAPQSAVSAPSGGYTDSRAAFSMRVNEFREAMGLLYIRNNASGRNKFRHKWPDVALFLFGEELIQMDNEGTQDRQRRAELEDLAGLKRIALKALLEEYEEKSVKSGVLNFEYIGIVLDKLGFEIGKLFYAEDIIARVRPNLVQKPVEIEVLSQAQVTQQVSEAAPISPEPYITAEEAAERDLAEQERLALRTMPPPPPQPLSLDQLQQEVRQSDQFTHMKIEISDEIRPIEVEIQPEALVIPPDQIFPQEISVESSVSSEMQVSHIPAPVSDSVYQQDIVASPQENAPIYQENTVQQVSNEPVIPPQQSPVYEQNIVETHLEEPIVETPVLSEIVSPILQEPVMATAVEPPQVSIEQPVSQVVSFAPPPDLEKKPRIQIAGLRIKDDQQPETQTADEEVQGH